jgi:ATP-binding cassette subfamily B protein/subfamily B ATP-binding cassette protein MsbA
VKNLGRALAFFRPDAPRIALAAGLLLLSTGASLIKPWPLAIIVDCLLGDKPMPGWLGRPTVGWDRPALIGLLALIILFTHMTQAALSTAHNYFLIQAGLRGLARVRNEVYRWLQRLSLRYHQGSTQGDIIYRASWDTYAFHTLFQHGVFSFIGAMLSLVLMLAIMLNLSWRLSLMAVGTAPLLLIAVRGFGNKMNARSLAAQESDSQVTTLYQQAITAMPLTQSCTREDLEQKQFAQCCERSLNLRLSQHRWELYYLAAIAVVFAIGVAGIAWMGAQQVLMGSLSLGQLLVFLAYLGQFYEPLNQLSKVGATMAGAGASIQRVFEVLDSPEEVKDAPQARPVCSRLDPAPPANAHLLTGRIEFDRVSFAYVPERPVLKSISFQLEAGESIAIVGPSGAGKTTLLHLLPRFFDPSEGTIRLDGVDLKELRLKDLRRHVSLLMQEPILLPATVAENIAYGKPGARLEDIRNAAKAACADPFIQQLPDGYDTLVGEGACRLSVGEKQRINLARAFLKNAPILLLDEPTSALDSESEATVLDGIRTLMQGRTTLVIAHRLATIQQASKVLVLEDGRMTHFAVPGDLLLRPGFFTRISAINARK